MNYHPADPNLPSAPVLSDAEHARLERICRAIVHRRRALFAGHPSVATEDLVQIAMVGPSALSLGGAVRAHMLYRPPHSYTVWIGRAATSALLTFARALGRQARHVHHFCEINYPKIAKGVATATADDEIFFECLPLAENRRKGAALNVQGYAAALVYRDEHAIGWRTLWVRMVALGLWRQWGFTRPPGLRSLQRARARLARMLSEEAV